MKICRAGPLLTLALSCFAGVAAQTQAGPELKNKKPAPHPVELLAQLGHSRNVIAVAHSPTHKQVLTGSDDSSARLWDSVTGREIRRFGPHGDSVQSVAFSPDGSRVVTGSLDSIGRVYDRLTGHEIHRLKGHSDGILSLSYSPDGKLLLTGSRDRTARLWDMVTGRELRRLEGHKGWIRSVAMSSDSKLCLIGSMDWTASLWDTTKREKLRTFHGHSEGVTAVSMSRDSKRVLTGSLDGTARLWEVATGKEVGRFVTGTGIWSVAFSPDDKHFLVAGPGIDVALCDTMTGKELFRFDDTSWPTCVALSPDGARALIGGRFLTAHLVDLSTRKMAQVFSGHCHGVTAALFSPDGKRIVTGSSSDIRFWDGDTGQEYRHLHDRDRDAIAFSPNGKVIHVGGHLLDSVSRTKLVTIKDYRRTDFASFSPEGDRFIRGNSDSFVAELCDAKSGEIIRSFTHDRGVTSGAYSPLGGLVLTGSFDGACRLWDVVTGKVERQFSGSPGCFTYGAFAPDGTKIVVGSGTNAWVWDARNGKEIARIGGASAEVTSVAFSRTGHVVFGRKDGLVELWITAAPGKLHHRLEGHANSVRAVAFSPSGNQVLTASTDGTTGLWDTTTGKKLCSLLSFLDGSWAVIDPEGRFDAAKGGDVDGLHWVAGNEPIALAQLKERYYDPGLLAKYMGFNKEPLRNVEAFKDVLLYPQINAQPPDKNGKLTLALSNRGGGLGKVQVFVNEREVLADARGGQKVDPEAASATLSVDLSGAVVMPGEVNDVKIVTWNSEGYLSSRSFDLKWPVPVSKKGNRPTELYAIVAGVSNYDGADLKLRFAAKDAEDMATALQLGGKRFFGADKVHVTLLCDSGHDKALAPTRANLEKAFAEAAKRSGPRDILVVYLAGHGIALPEGGQEIYCYLTKEARMATRDAFQDPALRKQYALTSTELTEWLKAIPALKQVLILDTCAAGAAAQKLMEKRLVPADQIRAIDRMKDRTGFHVLMGCAADRVSYEASHYSQGILTYALLQGMRGAALREAEYVDVSTLFGYAADQVPQLAKHIGGIQQPLVLAPKGTSFDVGRLQAADKKLIPLALVRPLVLRPVLLNVEVGDDDLGLMPLLRKLLADASLMQPRGQDKQLGAVFVDADEMPGAVRPGGTYTVQGDKVQVRLVLRRDGQTVASLQVEGVRTNLPALGSRMMSAIMEKLPGPQIMP